MDFHGVIMKGEFICEKTPTLPPHNPAEEGRLIYNLADTNMYVSGPFDWLLVAGFSTLLPASNVTYSPTGGISSTNVQSAITELDSEKANISHTHEIVNITDLDNPMQLKGEIATSNEFPLIGDVDISWVFVVTNNVTDNITGNTNTGQTFNTDDTIAWDGVKWIKLGSTTTLSYEEEFITLTPTDSANKFILLTKEPLQAETVSLKVAGSPSIIRTLDFNMDISNPKKLKWNGLELDGAASSGDVFAIQYIS